MKISWHYLNMNTNGWQKTQEREVFLHISEGNRLKKVISLEDVEHAAIWLPVTLTCMLDIFNKKKSLETVTATKIGK
jgi:hypothetical protein